MYVDPTSEAAATAYIPLRILPIDCGIWPELTKEGIIAWAIIKWKPKLMLNTTRTQSIVSQFPISAQSPLVMYPGSMS